MELNHLLLQLCPGPLLHRNEVPIKFPSMDQINRLRNCSYKIGISETKERIDRQ